MKKIPLNIKDSIADTLFITLYAKSVETQRQDPLITDLKACELVERVDYDFSKYKNKRTSSVGVAIRAAHFDRMVTQFIEDHQNPIVVLVGCGLDSRVQRIGKIADQAVFYELDIEEVINLRAELIPPFPNENYLPCSMLETSWMDGIKSRHPEGNFIFVIEGVLMYFNETDNQFVFTELAKRFKGAEIHFDMLNKWMSKKSSMHDTVSKTKATFKFGADDEKELEKWNPDLKHVRTYVFNEFKGYKRMGFVMSTLMSTIPVFKTAARLFTYKITDSNQ